MIQFICYTYCELFFYFCLCFEVLWAKISLPKKFTGPVEATDTFCCHSCVKFRNKMEVLILQTPNSNVFYVISKIFIFIAWYFYSFKLILHSKHTSAFKIVRGFFEYNLCSKRFFELIKSWKNLMTVLNFCNIGRESFKLKRCKLDKILRNFTGDIFENPYTFVIFEIEVCVLMRLFLSVFYRIPSIFIKFFINLKDISAEDKFWAWKFSYESSKIHEKCFLT